MNERTTRAPLSSSLSARPAYQHPELVAAIYQLTYDFGRRIGMLELPPCNYPDMGATIALFERIDSRVRQIQTIVGSKPDYTYTRSEGRWFAGTLRPTRGRSV